MYGTYSNEVREDADALGRRFGTLARSFSSWPMAATAVAKAKPGLLPSNPTRCAHVRVNIHCAPRSYACSLIAGLGIDPNYRLPRKASPRSHLRLSKEFVRNWCVHAICSRPVVCLRVPIVGPLDGSFVCGAVWVLGVLMQRLACDAGRTPNACALKQPSRSGQNLMCIVNGKQSVR